MQDDVDIFPAEGEKISAECICLVVSMVYGDCEGDLWEGGAVFERTNSKEIAALLRQRERRELVRQPRRYLPPGCFEGHPRASIPYHSPKEADPEAPSCAGALVR